MIPEEAIYVGSIMHMRLIPKKHKFHYTFFSLFLDVDIIKTRRSRFSLFSVNKFNVLSFYDRDHGFRDGTSLRSWVDDQLKKNKLPGADRVFLLSFPRMFGYVFNPFSAYFCYTNSVLTAIIYEVKNTFGDQICYTKAVSLDKNDFIEHSQKKKMYVSPFIEMDQVYSFLLKPPGSKLSIRISQSGKEGEMLVATQVGKAIELNNINLLRCALTYPFMTFKVIFGIHWEALILFLKGIKFYKYNTRFDQ